MGQQSAGKVTGALILTFSFNNTTEKCRCISTPSCTPTPHSLPELSSILKQFSEDAFCEYPKFKILWSLVSKTDIITQHLLNNPQGHHKVMMDFTRTSQGRKVFGEITLGRADTQREELKVRQHFSWQNKFRLGFYTRGGWKSSQMPGGGEGNKTPCSLWLVVCSSPLCRSYPWAAHRKEANVSSEHMEAVWCGQAQATPPKYLSYNKLYVVPEKSVLHTAAMPPVKR